MKRIIFVLETGSLAGGVRVVGELANRLCQGGWDVSVYSVNNKETLTHWFALDKRIRWFSFLRSGNVSDYDQLYSVLIKQDAFKVATFWRTAIPVNKASKPGEGLYLVQDIETVYVNGPRMCQAVIETYDYPLRKITTSRWVEARLPDCEYIGIGVSPFYTRLDGVPRQAYPLACARRQALKGWSELCETARYLDQAEIRLHTFGMDRQLQMWADPVHNVDPRTSKKSEGLPDDKMIRQLYNQAGCFVSSSQHEGFSLTPLEAMACGCPVIMTDAGGNMEYARDGENCLIARDPVDLAEKTIRVLKDKSLAARLSKSALETPKAYTWNSVLGSLEVILNQ